MAVGTDVLLTTQYLDEADQLAQRVVIAAAVRALDDLGVDVDDIGLRRPTLDEVFLTLTGAPIDAEGTDPAGEGAGTDETTTGERARPVAVHGEGSHDHHHLRQRARRARPRIPARSPRPRPWPTARSAGFCAPPSCSSSA